MNWGHITVKGVENVANNISENKTVNQVADKIDSFFPSKTVSWKNEYQEPQPVVAQAPTQVPQNDVVKRLSDWNTGEGSFYNATDPNQTRPDANGIGAYGRKVEKGSIAFGNRAFQDILKAGKQVYVAVKGFENVETPYGKGIFRIDDTMNERYNQKGKFNIDFHPSDLPKDMQTKGRFPLEFKIVKIE